MIIYLKERKGFYSGKVHLLKKEPGEKKKKKRRTN